MTLRRKHIVLIVAALILAAGTTRSQAADAVTEANATVHHRQKIMETVGGLMAALGCTMEKKCTLDNKDLKHAGKGLAFMAELAPASFKDKAEGATLKHTAKPDIWNEWAKFETGLKAMGEAATKVATLAGADKRDEALAAVGELGKTCKGCHDAFRTK
ncbi:MAG: cytochrome C class II [Rhodospirillaceae bacterium]|nr:MAG: cytochrome C class II [Rhodospirillaceae bacterium]